MADDNIQISFSANTADLRAQLGAAQASIARLTAEFASLREASKNTFGNNLSASIERMRREADLAGRTLHDIKGAAQAAAQGLEGAGRAAASAGSGIGFYAREFHAVIDEVLSGRTQQLSGTIANIGMTTTQMVGGFALANPAIAAMGVAAAATGGILAVLTMRALAANNAIADMAAAAAAAGNMPNFGGAKALVDISANAEKAATAIQSIWDVFGKGSAISATDAAELVGQVESLIGSSGELVNVFTLLSRQEKAIFHDEFKNNMKAVIKGFEDLDKGIPNLLSSTKNLSAAITIEANAALRSGDEHRKQAAALSIIIQSLRNASAEHLRAYSSYQALDSASKNLVETMLAQVAAGEKVRELTGDEAAQFPRLADEIQIVTRNLNRLEDAQRAFSAAKIQPQSVMDIGAKVLKEENSPETQLTGLNAKLAEAEAAVKVLDDQWKAMQATAGAALNERGKSLQDLQKEMGDYAFVIGTIKDKIQAVTDAQEGGSIVQKDDLATAREAARVGVDRLRAAISHQEAIAKEVALANDATLKAQKQLELEKAALEVTKLRGESLAAQDRLAAQRADKGSKEGLNANISAVRNSAAGAAPSSAEAINAETQILALKQDYDKRQADSAAATAKEEYQVALESIDKQKAGIQELTKEHLFGYTAQIAAAKAAATEKLAAEQAYVDEIGQLYTKASKEFEKAQVEQAVIHRRVMEELNNDTKKANEQMEQSFRKAFEGIASNVASGIMGMIEHTKKFSDAVRDLGRKMVSESLNAVLKMAADWAGGEATKLAKAVLTQTGMTAATATGTAARTGLEASAAAAGDAMTMGAVMKNIMASAAETFAGVFGFLAPVMGPAAAGPAAAAEGAVMATAVAGHFAVGSWSLPNDMVAQVHKGEMIVPAAATPWAQSLMANAAGGASGGRTFQNTNHFHINAVDASGFKAMFRANDGAMLKEIARAINRGAHLGIAKF